VPSKYGQEDALNQWQRGWQNLVRLLLLSISIGAASTIIWWQLRAPANTFYYLFQYWYSWLYCRLPFACSQVAVYNQQVLQPFIDGLWELLRMCGVVFSVTSFLSFVGLRYYVVCRNQDIDKERFIRGSRLLKPKELNLEIDTARTPQGNIKYPPTDADLYLGRERVRLPYSLSFRHLGIVGVPGTGKTQLFISIFNQLKSRTGHKGFILDLNGQYYARFGQRGDKILSLQDVRSEAWSFYGERGVPAEFIAQALVEVNNHDNFFTSAAQALLTDLITRNQNIEGVRQDLTSELSKLLEKLQGGISPSLLGAPEQAAGVIATAAVELGFLQQLHQNNQNRDQDGQQFFSLTDWVLSESAEWVFLIVKDVDFAATRTLLRLWVMLVVGAVLQRDEHKPYPHLWVFCDEFPGFGALPDIDKFISQGRKYKATMVAGYQVRGQIQHLYGMEGAKEIIAGLQNKVIFRTPDPSDAKEESLTLGEQEVEEVTTSAQLGQIGEKDSNSLQRGIVTRPVVMPSQLQNLADMRAYTKLCEFDPCLISFDYQTLPTSNQPQTSMRQISPTNSTSDNDNNNQNNTQQSPSISNENANHTQKNNLNYEDNLQWDIDPDAE
jgi:Type IV secretion-system coupling protein DNA-binding domain